MKSSVLIALLIAAAFNAGANEITKTAQSIPYADGVDKQTYCIMRSATYVNAAQYRDAEVTPQETLKILAPIKGVYLEEKKLIINQIYFDPSFEHARGEALRQQMLGPCINGTKAFVPLK